MSTSREKEALADVLNEYVESEVNPSHAALEKWIREYPEYKKELVEFTVSWSLMRDLPPPAEVKEVTSDTLLLRAMSVVEDRLYAHRQKKKASQPGITDLLKQTRHSGLSLQTIALQVGMSEQMITKLARRHIAYSTIPDEAVNRHSAACKIRKDDLVPYLQKPIMVPQHARFTAKSGPKAPGNLEDFFDAVKKDRSLGDSQRAFWLSFEKK